MSQETRTSVARGGHAPIPMLDLRAELAALRSELDAAIARVLDSAVFINGPEVTGFEAELAHAAGTSHAVGVSSGSDAILISLMALGIGPGDEVVTTPFSFFATAGCISRVGARPVFADIEESSHNLDPNAALAACSQRTRAIIAVHLYGRPATLPVMGSGSDIPIIEDAAQSLCAAPVRGLCAATSFFPSKNLGALGDGGAVLTSDPSLAERLRVLRAHGAKPKYYHGLIGGNFRLDALQAAVLRVKLPHLAGWTRARRANAQRYRALFAAAKLPPELHLPQDAPEHGYNQFVIRAPRRDGLREFLAAQGIETIVYYPVPLHLQACYADLGYRPGAMPNAERAAAEVLALPVSPALSIAQQERIVAQIAAFYAA